MSRPVILACLPAALPVKRAVSVHPNGHMEARYATVPPVPKGAIAAKLSRYLSCDSLSCEAYLTGRRGKGLLNSEASVAAGQRI